MHGYLDINLDLERHGIDTAALKRDVLEHSSSLDVLFFLDEDLQKGRLSPTAAKWKVKKSPDLRENITEGRDLLLERGSLRKHHIDRFLNKRISGGEWGRRAYTGTATRKGRKKQEEDLAELLLEGSVVLESLHGSSVIGQHGAGNDCGVLLDH